MTAALGLVGAVIMPHNIYLYSSLVLSRKIDVRKKSAVNEANVYNSIDSAVSLTISFCISTAIISTFAVYSINEVDKPELTLESASDALAKTFGESSKYIWAVGLLAAGQSSTMTGTYAGQFVMEGFLNIQLPIYQRVLITRSIAIVPALCIAFLNKDSLTQIDSYLNVLQSVQLPFALVPLVKFASSPLIMNQFQISSRQTIFASGFGSLLFLLNFFIIFSESELSGFQTLLVVLVSLLYISFIVVVIMEPIKPLKPISLKELEDHEFDRVEIDDDVSEDYENQKNPIL
mmetsp:Transcript_2305/g.3946  ORF Transcript_2305/g.3946 Transcript_2305/m.3946 type:complete len:290 (-) Transcript_2305:169-1038(-)